MNAFAIAGTSGLCGFIGAISRWPQTRLLPVLIAALCSMFIVPSVQAQLFAQPKMTAVSAPSPHRVVVTFDKTPNANTNNAANYTLTGAGNVPLVVRTAARIGSTKQVLLTTDRQQPVSYALRYPNRSGIGSAVTLNFNGSLVVEPALLSAVSLDRTRVRLRFSAPMGQNANVASFYKITRPSGGSGLSVSRAAFGTTPAEVILTTARQTLATNYRVTVGDIQSQTGVFIDPTQKVRDFNSSTPIVTSPRLLSIGPQGAEAVLLTFDQAMATSATELARYQSAPNLFVSSASLVNGGSGVLLSTGPHFAVNYTVTATGLTDVSGQATVPATVSGSVTGSRAINSDRPRVTSAASTGNTRVIVQFSKPMGDNAADPARYTIVQPVVNPEVGAVGVIAARFAGSDRLNIELTTRSQNEVTYEVAVNSVTDLLGNPLADPTLVGGVRIDPRRATFAGTPPTGVERVDADGDGLFDHEEASGLEIAIRLANGNILRRQVTSSPDSFDSDNDGLDDFTERGLGIDPRDNDTDDDGLSDFSEFNETFSDPAAQDTDGDGLTDGLEHNFFRTSSIFPDTDGDKLMDGFEVNLANRNPRVADVPLPTLEIGEMNLALDVRFVEVTSSDRKVVDSKTASSSLTQSDSQAFSNSGSTTIGASYTTSASVGFTAGGGFPKGGGGEVTGTTSFEASTSSSFVSEWSETSMRATEEAFAETRETQVETAEGANVTREVNAARVSVTVNLKNAGDLAFNIRNLQITALIQNPLDPTALTPIATLVPDFEPADGFNVGTLSSEVGPIIFSNTSIFPQLVESLMRNPTGLVFRFSNYDIKDETNRDFSFTEQDITDRTALLEIDYGSFDTNRDGKGDLADNLRVATGTGRLMRVDTNGDGEVDDNDGFRRVVFDGMGRPVGITLRDALQSLGLVEYNEDLRSTSSLSGAQQDNSYSVQRAGGVERIFRIRRAAIRPAEAREWFIITPTGIASEVASLDDVILNTGGGVALSFIGDLDGDGLTSLIEFVNGCSDRDSDTDDDGLDDRFETLIGWNVNTDRGSKRVVSSCTNPDSDQDGLSDLLEAPGVINRDSRGRIIFDPPGMAPRRDTSATTDPYAVTLFDPITDPNNADTDGDGLRDKRVNDDGDVPGELDGYTVNLRGKGPDGVDNTADDTVFVRTSPEFFDSDGDTASDGIEFRLGGNPLTDDFEFFGDTDGDGLVNVQEDDGYVISITGISSSAAGTLCSNVCGQGQVTTRTVNSNKLKRDTDGDGLSDREEFDNGTDPRAIDTDGDGLTDNEEVRGYSIPQLPDLGIVRTNPADADTDNDKRADGHEAVRPIPINNGSISRIIVRPAAGPAYQAYSDPRNADVDLDGLADGDEAAIGFTGVQQSDPGKFDTDGDFRSDRAERQMGTRPATADALVTLVFDRIKVDQDGDDGDSLGEWSFDLSVEKPDGSFTESMDSATFPQGLDNCGSDNEDVGNHLCRRGNSNEIWFTSGRQPLQLGKTLTVGSVSTDRNAFEKFAITGKVNESDGSSVLANCLSKFPDIGGMPTGIFNGPDMVKGVTPFEFHRSTNGGANETCEFRLYGFVEVR